VDDYNVTSRQKMLAELHRAVEAGSGFTARERMLHALIFALEAHGLPGGVGLLPAESWPRHRGGIGITVVLAPGDHRAAPAVAELLQAMGCLVRPHALGIEGHLRNGSKLLPAPPLPDTEVRSADSARSAEGAAVVPRKRCLGPCGAVLPLDSFSLNGRTPEGRQRRMHWCKTCHAAGQRDRYAARKTAERLTMAAR
jgi:hypothetical protein